MFWLEILWEVFCNSLQYNLNVFGNRCVVVAVVVYHLLDGCNFALRIDGS